MKAQERSTTQENRRGFVRHCFGVGASLAAIPVGSSQAAWSRKVELPNGTVEAGLIEYERILSHTDSMHIFGNPRSWSLVSQGLHPFAPERVVVLPCGAHSVYGDRCGRDLRRQIDKQIDCMQPLYIEGVDPKKWFPDCKRESIYWMMDVMTGHYGVSSFFEHWVVGLAGREKIFGSTACNGWSLAYDYQRGGEVPVDNPPVDWWLFLYPSGYDWGSLDEQPIFAIICYVAKHNGTYASHGAMVPLYFLACDLWRTVTDWSQVAQMGRVGACRHLNRIAAQCLANKAL